MMKGYARACVHTRGDAEMLMVLLQELAWASCALLRNTNTCGVLLFDGNRAVMARGAMGPAANTDGQVAGTQACLQRLSKVRALQLTVHLPAVYPCSKS